MVNPEWPHRQGHGVQNIRRWTQFCDPLKKKNGMERFLEKNKIKDVSSNSNNLEATFVELSEKIHYFIAEFIDVWQQFAVSYSFVTVTVKKSQNRFVINEI